MRDPGFQARHLPNRYGRILEGSLLLPYVHMCVCASVCVCVHCLAKTPTQKGDGAQERGRGRSDPDPPWGIHAAQGCGVGFPLDEALLCFPVGDRSDEESRCDPFLMQML